MGLYSSHPRKPIDDMGFIIPLLQRMTQTAMALSGELHTQSLKALKTGLEDQDWSSDELCEHFGNRIAQYDSTLNSFNTVIEKPSGQTSSSKLAGIPYALKDLFCTKGVLTTCSSKMLHNFVAPYNAHVTEKLQQSGAILMGKNNMDEFAMGSSNENSHLGSVKNPWSLSHVPGGSSGGGAAAVAARLVPYVIGTDTGGSIRQPAAFCGITGIKPTYGRVSRFGMIAFASSLDQAGPMAISAEDCATVLNEIAGHDPRDSTSSTTTIPDFTQHLNQSLAGLKVGVVDAFFDDGLDQEIAESIQSAIKQIESLGATVHSVKLPHARYAVPAYYVIAPAECSSNLSRMDGVRFGHRCENPKDLDDLYQRSRSEGFGGEVQRRILVGTYALSAGYYDAYYLKAQRVRRLIKQDFVDAFKEVDVILGPTAPTAAFELGQHSSDPLAMYLADIYTVPASLAGLPCMSIPAGFTRAGLPIGLQAIGHYFDESRLLNLAHQYQQTTDWHLQMPSSIA